MPQAQGLRATACCEQLTQLAAEGLTWERASPAPNYLRNRLPTVEEHSIFLSCMPRLAVYARPMLHAALPLYCAFFPYAYY
jgi:hypothetical protein